MNIFRCLKLIFFLSPIYIKLLILRKTFCSDIRRNQRTAGFCYAFATPVWYQRQNPAFMSLLSIMPPRRHLNHQTARESVNDWSELRQTLLAMQENIQVTIHDSIQEVVELFQLRDQGRRRSWHGFDVESEDDVNPFTEYRSRRGDEESDVYQERDDRRWKSGFKVEISEFHGGVRGKELLDWLVAAEEAIDFKKVPEDRKVALVATKFQGKAASWWLQVKATRSRARKDKIRSWEKLQKMLKSSFLPYNFDRTMFTRLQNFGKDLALLMITRRNFRCF